MRVRLTVVALGGVALIALGSCAEMFRSDAENAGRQSEEAQRNWVRSSRIASSQAAPAEPVRGAALTRLLAGKTHVIEYRMSNAEPAPYYVTYDYYRADGRFIFLDTRFRQDPDEHAGDRWRVDDDVLCLLKSSDGETNECFKVKVEAGGAIQYWIHRPGDPKNGLITKSVRIVKDGMQTPAFVRLQWPTR